MRSSITRIGLLILVSASLAACESAYYSALETVGVHKRDLLVSNVEDAMEAQEDAKVEFEDALEQFAGVVDIEPSELQDAYESLNDAFEDAETRANAVSSRIDAVEDVSEDLFDEWREEAGQISNARLRSSSLEQLRASERKYDALIKSMRKAEGSMQPVLTAFRDHVLFLKHNLNARAIASLEGELGSIEDDVGVLVRDMEASISQAQSFIEEMELL